MSHRIRVLHITSRLNVGGLARLVLMANEQLDPSRFESMLLTGQVAPGEGDILEVEKRGAARLRVVPGLGRNPSPWNDLKALRELRRTIRAYRPAVVHTHAAKAGTLGRLAARAAGVPVRVHSYHGHVFSGYFNPMVSRAIVAVERGLARATSAIAVPGESQVREIADRYRIAPRSKVHVLPYGIDTEFYGTRPSDRGAVRRSLGIPADARVVGAVGRMAPVKNHGLLLDAFDRLAATPARADAHLLLVGGGECRAEIAARAARSPAAARIHFAGWMEDLRDAYAAMDVLALTSLNEGMPVAVMEAMAAGVPVVSTRAGGVVDLVESGRNGLLLDRFDAGEMAETLARVLSNGSLGTDLAAQARRDIVVRHSHAAHVNGLARLYDVLLKESFPSS